MDYAHEVWHVDSVARGCVSRSTTQTRRSGRRSRQAITHKHPAVLVVGDQDVENQTVGVRLRHEDEEKRGVPVEDVVAELVALMQGADDRFEAAT